MFHMFKKKESPPPQQPTQPQQDEPQQPIEQDYYKPNQPQSDRINSWRRKFNFFGGSDEQLAKQSLSKYSIPKKPLVWNYGEGERKIGYAFAIIPRPHGECIILYKQKSRDFLDELFNRLKEMLLGSKERYRVLYVPDECITVSNEIVTIYAHSFKMENEFTEIAIPLEEGDQRKRIIYEMALERVGLYESAMAMMRDDMNNIVNCALYLNPTLKTYRGNEMKEGKKGEKQFKAFEGSEFSFDGVINRLKDDFTKGGFND
jgi:hypothetical protein